MEHTLTLNDVLLKYAENQQRARTDLSPSCHVCKICNGVACAGRFTNSLEFGSKGNNGGFIAAVNALRDIRIELDPIHEDYNPDTSCSFFGRKFDLPVFASPIAKILTDYKFDSPFFNNNGKYADALIKGCYEAGGMAWLGDNKEPGYFEAQVAPLKEVDGCGVPTIKPWAERSEFWHRVELCKEAGAMAIATDLDAIGLGYQYSGTKNEGVCSRTVDELKEIVERIDRPVVIKGIMSVKAAVKCKEAGAYGGVRSGEDVFKMLALGADAVGIGRPYVVSVYGGEQEGANIYTQKIYHELMNIMRLANCRDLSEITADKLILLNKR